MSAAAWLGSVCIDEKVYSKGSLTNYNVRKRIQLNWHRDKATSGRSAARFPAEARDFPPKCPAWLWEPPSLLFSGNRGSLRGSKVARREVDYSLPSSATVKNEWSYNPAPTICVCGVDRDNFTFTRIRSSGEILWWQELLNFVFHKDVQFTDSLMNA
jgi:hypothetical protein